MKKSVILFLGVVFLSACQTSAQVKIDSNSALEKEHQIWSELARSSRKECSMEVSRKTQLARQSCLDTLIRRDVLPYVSYPHLVEDMLDKMKEQAEKYASGKISKKIYEQNANAVSRDYWNNWNRAWNTKISSASSNPFEGLGDVLLVGVQTTVNTLRNHQQAARENAERNRPLHCIGNGYTATCN